MALPTFQQMLAQTNPNGVSFGGGTQGLSITQMPGLDGVTQPTSGAVKDSTTGAYDPQAAADAAAATTTAQDLAFLDTQKNDLNSLLGRTNTGLDQGLANLNQSYQTNVNDQTSKKNQALSDFGNQRVQTNKDKLAAYDTTNKNINNGYRSLAQIIGRGAGTGSSAFQDLLPEVLGNEASSQRTAENQTYGQNMGNIDTAQKKTESSFQSILDDLARQRQSQEGSLRSGIESQRQSLNDQLQQNAAARVQAQGGGYDAVKAAEAPYQSAIENSRNAVENFFNQFNPGVKAGDATIAAPDLSQYQVDRATLNDTNAGGQNTSNPYADILRKKLQDQTL